MMRKLILPCALLWLMPQAGAARALDAPVSSIPFEGESVDAESIESLIAQLTAVNSGLTPMRAEAAGARVPATAPEARTARLRFAETMNDAVAALEARMAEARATMEREVREAMAAFESDLRRAGENAERRAVEAEEKLAAERARSANEASELEGRIDDLIRENQALRSSGREYAPRAARLERAESDAAIEAPVVNEVHEADPAGTAPVAMEAIPAAAPTTEQFIRALRVGLTLTQPPGNTAPRMMSGRPMNAREIRAEIALLRAEIARLKREETAQGKVAMTDRTIPPARR